ncbi:glycoside hydrolase family 43 protein [Haloarchaeobius sp. DFWS5]|uniref:glycoside hydrolase family 43 protein n=1 Tax=Haloarchaeobius sp. DFWS5 TaxID=3446114 RepID=UPI003EB7C9A7
MAYQNPILPGTHPDPTVCRVGDDYYLATSSFEYFPGVPLYHSDDLVSWNHIGHCLTRESQLDLAETRSSGGIYAPTLRHHDGTFYLVTTHVDGGGNFVVTADDPAGEWSDPTYIDAPGFDPDLFFDDGTAYFSYAAGPTLAETTIKQVTVDLDSGEVGDERELWRGFEGSFSEAPHLYERDGVYYLLTAEGGTHVNHMVVTGRADSPTGPFEPCPSNPVLSHRGHPMGAIKAAGHGDLVQAPDDSWWLVFLGIRQRGGHPGWHHLGRETFLAPVEWVDGWPVVNGGDPVKLAMDADGLPGASSVPVDHESVAGGSATGETETTFDGESLPGEFEYRRNPEPGAYTLDEDESGLVLRGRTTSLDEVGATFVGRRQAHFDGHVETTFEFDPDESEDAGLALVADEDHHYEVGVGDHGDGPVSFVRLRIGEVCDRIAERPISGTDHHLSIDANAGQYVFRYVAADGTETELGTASTRYLATEVTGSFTGVYVGPYATSPAAESTPARFELFAYEPTE